MSYKKFLAVALATTMLVGSSLTVFATEEDPTEAATGSIDATGAGASEGYVDTTITKVIVPTAETVEAGIAYKVDPQRLITATGSHSDSTFPEENDTGVYFLTGNKTYDNKSETFYVANKGTGDVTFTIKAEVVSASTDLALDSKANAVATTPDPTTAKLYLGVLIGKEATAAAMSKDAAVQKKAVLATVPANFEYTYDETNGYGFAAKAGSKWNAVPIQFEGAITEIAATNSTAIAAIKDKTVPGIKLTYSWAAKSGSDSTDSGVTVDDAFEDTASGSATVITGAYVSSNTRYELTLPNGVTLATQDASEITNLKVNGVAVTTGVAINGGKNVIRVTRAGVQAALGNDFNTATSLTFTFTAGGVNYSAANVAKN